MAIMHAALLASIAALLSPSVCAKSGNRINKHTYASNDGVGDYNFVNKYFCTADTSTAPSTCAVDMKSSCGGGGFDLHMVQSYITKNGTDTPDEWYSYLHGLHGKMETWNPFMHYGTTFSATDLSAHLAKFQADKVPFMARKTTSGTILYSLLVQTPSAKVMEIVSSTAPTGSDASLFTAWSSAECPAAHERTVKDIAASQLMGSQEAQSQDIAAGQLMGSQEAQSKSSSLPKLTAIGVNIAASAASVAGIGDWLTKYNISGKKTALHKGTDCHVATITYSNAVVRYVSNPSAPAGSKTVEQWEQMQMAAHKKYVGAGTGWDAWMDNHWCVGVDHSNAIDSVAKLWAADKVSYHAHKSAKVSSVRSVGFGGESIEINGEVDGSFLKKLKGFDFCTASTDPATASAHPADMLLV